MHIMTLKRDFSWTRNTCKLKNTTSEPGTSHKKTVYEHAFEKTRGADISQQQYLPKAIKQLFRFLEKMTKFIHNFLFILVHSRQQVSSRHLYVCVVTLWKSVFFYLGKSILIFLFLK